MSQFADQVVVVTGAGRGLGREIAEKFAGQGAMIAANDVTPINLDVTVARIRSQGGGVRDYVFDIAINLQVQAMVAQILQDFGKIDLLINNAGVEPCTRLLEMDEWDWRRTLEVNLSGPFFMIQAVGQVMRSQGKGVIVNIAAADSYMNGLTNRAAFIASKMGLIGLTHGAAQELAGYGIRVNAVCPGNNPGDEEVVNQVLFLCGAAASHLTGRAIAVDGSQAMIG
jgi:NAD(P)-dependent dehydrogenase (short-subunit alcohol dehydrogenase family)